MRRTIIVGTTTILNAIRSLYERGEITLDQYQECQRRAADSEDKEDTVIEVNDND